MPNYKSDIKLGEEYEHARNGLKGHAIAVYFRRTDGTPTSPHPE